jgi:plastocyanin
MAAIRPLIVGFATLAMLASSPAPRADATPLTGRVDVGIENLVETRAEWLRALPNRPAVALAHGLAVLGARLGLPLDPQPALTAARLDANLTGRLALLLEELTVCHDATARLIEGLPAQPWTLVAQGVVRAAPAGARALGACAERVQRGGLELEGFLAGGPPDLGGDVDLWPVLRLDLDGSDDVMVHDYVLSVDRAGNDVYANNVGGNALDVRRGPPGSGAPVTAPARGCENPTVDLEAGECVLSAALLVDLAGDDTYGRLEPPHAEADGICTDDPLVRRIVTAGAGFAGAGVLLDAAGNDRYLGKTVTQGAGHLGGVGILRDDGGDDTYTAVRMAKGFGIAAGLGILRDLGGHDLYTYSMPRPRDPAAPYQTAGSGGVLNTTGICDNAPRWDEGVGISGGAGVLVDDTGDDAYRAASPLDRRFGGSNGPLRRTGSQGFGDLGGFGALIDRSGRDSYTAMPGRTDGVTLLPRAESTGLFLDRSDEPFGGTTAMGSARPPTMLTAHRLHFVPTTVSVEQGDSVQFLNSDPYGNIEGPGHTVTERRSNGRPRFDTGVVPVGVLADVRGVSVLPAGRYAFYCRIHPFMTGTVVIR